VATEQIRSALAGLVRELDVLRGEIGDRADPDAREAR
ncbi:MAG: hypothetical protein QOH45_3603, partial [Pseudonocardiales bacterium]|nr:hypothetical protein [Pseudonocardiales bacterium]